MRHGENTCGKIYFLPSQSLGSAFTVPTLHAVSEGLPDCRTQVDQVAYAHGYIAANHLKLAGAGPSRGDDFAEAPRERLAGSGIPEEQARHLHRTGGVDKGNLLCQGDFVLDELRERDHFQHAADSAKLRHEVDRIQLIGT